MNRIYSNILTRHGAVLKGWDAIDAAPPGETPTADWRLRRSGIILVAGGQVGLAAALGLARLPLRTLCLLPLREEDAPLAERVSGAPGRRVESLLNFPPPFSDYSLGASAANYHLIVVATDRPYPDLYERLNKVCLRASRSWTQAHVWGAEIKLGPTIMPGVTACHDCYQHRRKANEARQNAWAAQDQFLRNDPGFTFEGSLGLMVRLAAAYVCAEATRFLTAELPPLSLGREVLFDALLQTQKISQVIPVEGCPLCRMARGGAGAKAEDELGAMVRRLVSRRGGTADVA